MSSYFSIQQNIERSAELGGLDQRLIDDFVVTCLYFAQLSYFKINYIWEKLDEFSPENISYYDKNGVRVFFAEFETFAVISFRGREVDRWKELRTDLKFWKTEFDGRMIHAGFLESLNYVSKRLLLDIDDMPAGKRLLYTGHSMGGALATLLALTYPPTDVCTFGSPKVAAPGELSSALADVNVLRVFLTNDYVPSLPPDLFGYEHYGTPLAIDSENEGRWKSHLLTTYLRNVLKHESTETEFNSKSDISD